MIIPAKFDPETFFGEQLIPLAKQVLRRVGLPPAIYEAEELIADVFLNTKQQLNRSDTIRIDDATWPGYWYSILLRTAFRKLRETQNRQRQKVSEDDETGLSLLENLTSDEGKSAEQMWTAIEEAKELEKWSLAVEENLPAILDEEILRVSRDPYFKSFVHMVIDDWSRARPAYTEAYRKVTEEAAHKGEQPAKSRAQFIRDFETLLGAIRGRWDSQNLARPANLPRNVNVENVSPYYLRWILTEKNQKETNEENEKEIAISTEQVKRKDA